MLHAPPWRESDYMYIHYLEFENFGANDKTNFVSTLECPR